MVDNSGMVQFIVDSILISLQWENILQISGIGWSHGQSICRLGGPKFCACRWTGQPTSRPYPMELLGKSRGISYFLPVNVNFSWLFQPGVVAKWSCVTPSGSSSRSPEEVWKCGHQRPTNRYGDEVWSNTMQHPIIAMWLRWINSHEAAIWRYLS